MVAADESREIKEVADEVECQALCMRIRSEGCLLYSSRVGVTVAAFAAKECHGCSESA